MCRSTRSHVRRIADAGSRGGQLRELVPVRAALATDDAAAALLDTYARRVPLGGTVQAAAHGEFASLTLAFDAEGAGKLLLHTWGQ